MVTGKGFIGQAALTKATTWGTAVTCGTGDQIRILSESMGGGPEYLQDDTVFGTPFRGQGDTGPERWEGTLETYLRYRGLDLLVGLAFGNTGGAPTNASSTVYQQYFRPASDMEGLMATLCIDRVVNIAEFDSIKVNSLTISGAAGERVTISADILGGNFTNDSTDNVASTAWTDPDASNREYVMFEDAVIYLEANSVTSMVVGDSIYPSEFSLTITNNFTGDITTKNAPVIDEPIRDGFFEVTGSLTFPVFGTTSGADGAAGEKWEDAFLAATNYAMEIMFTGSQIISPYNTEFNIYLPNIQFMTSEANIDGPGKIGHTLTWEATKPVSVFDFSSDRNTTFTDAIWLEVQNRETSDVLA